MRAYRLSFDAKVGKFVIEFQGFLGIRWIKARTEGGPEGFNVFKTYAEARAYVDEIGLDEVYEDFTKGPSWKRGPTLAELSQTYPNLTSKDLVSKHIHWAVPPEFLKREGATS